MKITKTSSNKTKIILNQQEWETMGKKAGWLKESQESISQRHTVKVTFEDGNTIVSEINGTKEEIEQYYLNNSFNFGDSDEHPQDKVLRATNVEFIED